MNMELYSKVFKNIRRIDLLLVVILFWILNINIYGLVTDFTDYNLNNTFSIILPYFLVTLFLIILLEVLSFLLFIKATKDEFKFNLKTSWNLYLQDIFNLDYKNDKPISTVLKNIFAVTLIFFFGLIAATWFKSYIYKIELRHNHEIIEAKMEVAEQCIESNKIKLDE